MAHLRNTLSIVAFLAFVSMFVITDVELVGLVYFSAVVGLAGLASLMNRGLDPKLRKAGIIVGGVSVFIAFLPFLGIQLPVFMRVIPVVVLAAIVVYRARLPRP